MDESFFQNCLMKWQKGKKIKYLKKEMNICRFKESLGELQFNKEKRLSCCYKWDSKTLLMEKKMLL